MTVAIPPGKGDEQVKAGLQSVTPGIGKLFFSSVPIHEADVRRGDFGEVEGAFVRVVDGEAGSGDRTPRPPRGRLDRHGDALRRVYRDKGGWKFRAVVRGFRGGLSPTSRSRGVNAG